jgi:magnesium transporter
MLKFYLAPKDGAKALWADLLDPTDDEKRQVSQIYGIDVPSRESLGEIESSSRLVNRDGVLYLSMPLVTPDSMTDAEILPLGFIFSPEFLVTVRFSQVHAFDIVAAFCGREKPPRTSTEILAVLLEAMVDYGADLLEKIGADVAGLSRRIFHGHAGKQRNFTRSNRELRFALANIGAVGDHLSEIRESLLGLQRIAPFIAEAAQEWVTADMKTRLKSIERDLRSLSDFETHLSGKIQFLLDAILGFINTEQNDIFKVLTIVSVVGIPPTLVASMYGMNFKNMPELSWSWGYEYGLALILLSTLVPILWFKWRGWW